jgi:predicted metal-binding membrane protein
MNQSMAMMDGPGSLPSFLWIWIAMSAAMMLPSVVPAVSLAGAVGRSEASFASGYFAVWAASGVLALAADRGLMHVGHGVTFAALLVAAAYQLSPLKDACLRRCRSPLGSLLSRGAFPAGLEHGLLCLGCCWALMLVLLAVGSGSLLWMVAVSAVIFVEKVTRVGAHARVPVALGLLGAAVWIAL